MLTGRWGAPRTLLIVVAFSMPMQIGGEMDGTNVGMCSTAGFFFLCVILQRCPYLVYTALNRKMTD
jgi:hypothetical protein